MKEPEGAKRAIPALLTAARNTTAAASSARRNVAGLHSKTQKLAKSKNQIELVTLPRVSRPTIGSTTSVAASPARR
jgi:hypothetical protein